MELKNRAYNDPCPVWCLPGQEWGADGQHEEGHRCDGHPQQQLEQGDEQRETTDLAFVAILWLWTIISLLVLAWRVWGNFLPFLHFCHFLNSFPSRCSWLSLLKCLESASLPFTSTPAKASSNHKAWSAAIWKQRKLWTNMENIWTGFLKQLQCHI